MIQTLTCPCCGHQFEEPKPDVKNQYLTALNIIDACIDYFDITRTSLLSKTRKKEVSACRHVAMYLVRKYTRYSHEKSGKLFNRDHTTVIHAERRVRDSFFTKGDIYQDVIQVEERLQFNPLKVAS